jgi:hypothetical protein
MQLLKQTEATAARREVLVELVDYGDGWTPETGVTSPTIEVRKAGGSQAAGAGTFTEVGDGVYSYEFTAGELDTPGVVNLRVVKGTQTRDFQAAYQVVSFDPYDGARLGLATFATEGTKYYVSADGDDTTGDGLGWATAFETLGKACTVAAAGDQIIMGESLLFAESTALTIPCSVKGQGKLKTKVSNSVASANAFYFPGNGELEDIWIDATDVGSTTLRMEGVNAVRRARITGTHAGLIADGTQIEGLDSEIFIDAPSGTPVGLLDQNASLIATYRNFTVQTKGGTTCQAYYNAGALAYFWDCTLQAEDGSVHNYAVRQALGDTYIIRSDLLSGGTDPKDVKFDAGEIYLVNSAFDPDKASGYELIDLAGLKLIQAKTDTISGAVTVTGPFDPTDDTLLTLIAGDGYESSTRKITITFANYAGPSMAGATGKLRLTKAANYQQGATVPADVEVDATITHVSTTVTFVAILHEDDTDDLQPMPGVAAYTHYFQAIATTTANEDVTLMLGRANVARRIEPAAP